MTVWSGIAKELLEFFSKFLSFLEQDGALQSYLFSHSDLITELEEHVEEAFLAKFIHLTDNLKRILEQCEALQNARAYEVTLSSFDWPLDKGDKENTEEKTVASWAEFGGNSNDDAFEDELLEKKDGRNAELETAAEDALESKPQENEESNKFVRLASDGSYCCSACDKTFSTHSAVVRHHRTHTGERPFPCDFCHKSFASKTSLEAHQLRQHLINVDSALACQECGKLFVRHNALEVHSITHRKEKPFPCSICPKSFSQKVSLDIHISRHTGKLEHCCSECERKFPSRAKLNEHMNQHRSPRFQCDACGKQFVRPDSLRAHQRVHTGHRPFQCPICDKTFHTASNLRLHQQTHTNEPGFKCEQCGAQFKHKSSLNTHSKCHLSTGHVTCRVAGCERSFPHARSLQIHLRNCHHHYLCAMCGREFASRQGLVEHGRTHESQLSPEEMKPHTCHLCSRKFAQKSKLNAHVKTHLQDPTFACTICGKRFHRKDVLANHMFLHSGKRPYSCAHCGKSFAFKSNLSSHLATHPSDVGHQQAEFPCPECGKKFRHHSSLKLHRKSHTGQFSHTCEACGKKFLKKSHYEGHLRSHDNERPFQCPTCGKGYKERKHCREHVKRLHRNDFNLETLFASITSEDAQVADMLCSEQAVPSPSLNLFPNLEPILQEMHAQPHQWTVDATDRNNAPATLAVLSSEETTSVLSQGL